MRRTTLLAVLVGLALSSVGCGRYRSVEAAHARYCAANPGSIELFLDGPPDRPYRVVGIVDSPSETSPGRRARNNQIAACRLGANAIVDDAQRGRGLAIQYEGDAAPHATTASNPTNVTIIGQTWSPASPDLTSPDGGEDGAIQIQTNGGIEIHAPSVEVREAPEGFRVGE